MEFRTSIDYGFEKFHAVLTAEGRKATYDFVNEAPQTPPVHVESVAYLLYDLRGQVLRGAADGCGTFLVLQYLRQAEVSQLDVPHLVDYDVLGLEAKSGRAYSRYITLCLCSSSRATTICAA